MMETETSTLHLPELQCYNHESHGVESSKHHRDEIQFGSVIHSSGSVTSVGAGFSIGRPSSGVGLALSIRFADSLLANVYKITSRGARSQNYLAVTQRKVDILPKPAHSFEYP